MSFCRGCTEDSWPVTLIWKNSLRRRGHTGGETLECGGATLLERHFQDRKKRNNE